MTSFFVQKNGVFMFCIAGCHAAMRTLKTFHSLKPAGLKQIIFYFAGKTFISLRLVFLPHRVWVSVSLWYSILVILTCKYFLLVLHSVYYHSNSRFLQVILFLHSSRFSFRNYIFETLSLRAPLTSPAASWFRLLWCSKLPLLRWSSTSWRFM